MKAMVTLLVALTLSAPARAEDPVFVPPKPKEGYSYPECYCTNRGEKVQMGEYSCLRIGGKEFSARCGMSLNNPAWRDMTPGCDKPLSRAPSGFELFEPA